jgi:short-subunit dehydrogenase
MAALPALVAAQGLIVTVSSVAGFAPLIARTGYAASKHALHGFFESLRAEIAPLGVDVMMVCPSFVATHIDRNALGGDGRPVRHAQLTDGQPLSADFVAGRILTGASRGHRLLLVGRTARLAWWASRISPALYERLMARRFAGELEYDSNTTGRDGGSRT